MYRQSFQLTGSAERAIASASTRKKRSRRLELLLEPSAEDSQMSWVSSPSATQWVNGTRFRNAKFPLLHAAQNEAERIPGGPPQGDMPRKFDCRNLSEKQEHAV